MSQTRSLLSRPTRSFPLVGLALAFFACAPEPEPGPAGPQGPPGETGDPGAEGPPGSAGFDTLVATSPVERGSDACAYGGTRYDVGVDDGANGGVARDGNLQPGEIHSTHYVCNTPGAYPGIDEPTGPAGLYTIRGVGGSSNGEHPWNEAGGGGLARVELFGPTGGHVGVWRTGRAASAFTVPSDMTMNLGPTPLVHASTSTTLQVTLIDQGTEGSLSVNTLFQFRGTFDHYLYRRTTSGYERITGVHVGPGATLRFTPDTAVSGGQDARVWLPGDLFVEGTVTTGWQSSPTNHRPGLMLVARNVFTAPGALIDLRGTSSTSQPGRGGRLVLIAASDHRPNSSDWYCGNAAYSTSTSGTLINEGTVDVSGGSALSFGWNGGRAGGQEYQENSLCAVDRVYNTGSIYGRGGAGEGSYYGGGAGVGRLLVFGYRQGAYNAGVIDIAGGSGTQYGGEGGGVQIVGQTVRNTAVLDARGGHADCTDGTNSCSGGRGGRVTLVGLGGGGVATTGALYAMGGSHGGSPSSGSGGRGGSVFAYGAEGYDPLMQAFEAGGDVQVSGDIDVSGGAGVEAGYGGEFTAVVGAFPQLPFSIGGQSVSLLGYTQIDLYGGYGPEGGKGGMLVLRQTDIALADGGDWGSLALPRPPTGAIVLDVPVDARGGEALTPEIGIGGAGGALVVVNNDFQSGDHSHIQLRSRVDLRAGSGAYGGESGVVAIDGPRDVHLAGDLDFNAGAGTVEGGLGYPGREDVYVSGIFMDDEPYSGFRLRARAGTLSVTGDVAGRGGGGGPHGGMGAHLQLLGHEVDIAGDVDVSGGATGAGAPVRGGDGGLLRVWSAGSGSVVTGALSSDPGEGPTDGHAGWIVVDGVVQQWGGYDPPTSGGGGGIGVE